MTYKNFCIPGREFQRPLIRLVLKLYKTLISPIFFAFGARCRFMPTCSEYASEALIRHGFFRGGLLSMRRVCRCQPFGSSGVDPVPQEFSFSKCFSQELKFDSSQQ